MTEYRGNVDGQGLKIAIVSAEFAEKDGGALAELQSSAKAKLTELNADFDIFYVPGVFEIPTACRRILKTEKYDAIVTLGVVVKGETAHFEFVSQAATDGVAQLGRSSGVPILFGVLTCYTTEQAAARGHLGADYAAAAVQMASLTKQIDTLK